MNNLDAAELAQRYVAIWTEPDPATRRSRIAQLWADDGAHLLHPPAEIREAAAAVGFADATLDVRGHDQIEKRVTHAYEQFVAPGEYTFRASGTPVRLRDVVKLRWDMVPVGGGEPVGGGTDVLVLDDEGRVRTDYQFPDL